MMYLAEEAMGFVSKDGIDEVKEYVKLLGQYVKDIANGSYKGYSKSKLALAVAALVYLVVPTDCVPDFLPLAGYLDDVTVISFAFKQMRDEIMKYKNLAQTFSQEEGAEDIEFDEAEEIKS